MKIKKSIRGKFFVMILVSVLLLITLLNSFLGVQSEFKDTGDFSVSKINYSENNSIDYDYISTNEKENLSLLVHNLPEMEYNELADQSKAQTFSIEEETVERYLTLKDIDENEKYLYVEYNAGGYAIYDRIAEFIYEKSQFGSGPYNDYDDDENLYFVGPAQFYVKENNQYTHVITDEELSMVEMTENSAGVEYVRSEYLAGEASEMSLSAVERSNSTRIFSLGQNIVDSEMRLESMLYFASIGMAHAYNFMSKDTLQTVEVEIKDKEGKIIEEESYTDALMGMNYFGSCTFVSLTSVMTYYDRIGKANMIPNDISGFNMMYDYGVTFYRDYYKDYLRHVPAKGLSQAYYTGNLSEINKNLMKSEFVHQQLIYNTFPQHRGKSTQELINLSNTEIDGKKMYPFGYSTSKLGEVYNDYADKLGLANYSYSTRTGTSYLPERIVEGNPCIVSLSPGYPNSTTAHGAHSAVAYGFTGTKRLWWYTVDSVLCNYGWHKKSMSSAVEVNKNFISHNNNLNVF